MTVLDLASNIESLLKTNMIFGIANLWDDCDDFLWETEELSLSNRLQLADRYGRENVFVSFCLLLSDGMTGLVSKCVRSRIAFSL